MSSSVKGFLSTIAHALRRRSSPRGAATPDFLGRFPAEILLYIVTFLPPESAVCLCIVSKFYNTILSPGVDMKLREDARSKRRFLLLLEHDLPALITCYACNKLYPWSKPSWSKPTWSYSCRHRYCRSSASTKQLVGISFCRPHMPFPLYHPFVEAYLRGAELGPAYGPPLSDLAHQCSGVFTSETGHRYNDNIKRTIRARVVRGKLVLHRTFKKSVFPFDLELSQLKFIGCQHSHNGLFSIIKEAVKLARTTAAAAAAAAADNGGGDGGDDMRGRRCQSLLNCAYCATDFCVRTKSEGKTGQVLITVDIWQCLGGRDLDQEDLWVRAMFGLLENFNYRELEPARNLAQLYFEGGQSKDDSSSGLEHIIGHNVRQNWLQLCY